MAGVEVIRELLIKLGVIGDAQTESALMRTQAAADKTSQAFSATRNQLLFLSFGLLAAGGLATRIGSALKGIGDQMREAWQAADYQATIAATLMKGELQPNIAAVREELFRLGRDTEFTATQAGEAMRFLAMAGFDVNAAIGATASTLKLATIGMIDTETAADIATTALKSFQMEIDTVTQASQSMSTVVGMMAQAISDSKLTVEEMGEALKFVGAIAQQAGWELSEVTAFLMAVADQGVRAGIAGRALRMSLIRMAKAAGATAFQMKSAEEVIAQFNLQLIDSEGNLKDMVDIVEELEGSLGKLEGAQRIAAMQSLVGTRGVTAWAAALAVGSEELKKMQFELEAAAAREVLFNDLGADSIATLKMWHEQVQAGNVDTVELVKQLKAMGFEMEAIEQIIPVITSDIENFNEVLENTKLASQVTEERLKSLHGTQILLKSSIDTMYASLAEGIVPIFLRWNRASKKVADQIERLPKPLKTIIGGLVIFGGSLLQVIGTILTTVGTITMLSAALAMMQMQAGVSASSMVALAGGMTLVKAATIALIRRIWMLTISIIRLMLQLLPLLVATLIIQHVWVRFGKTAGMLTAAIFLLAFAVRAYRNGMRLANVQTGAAVVLKGLYAVATLVATAATWAFNTAIYANPAVWLVAALVLLVLVLVKLQQRFDIVGKSIDALKRAMVIWYQVTILIWIKGILWLMKLWDQFKKKLEDMNVFNKMTKFFGKLIGHSIWPEYFEAGTGRMINALDKVKGTMTAFPRKVMAEQPKMIPLKKELQMGGRQARGKITNVVFNPTTSIDLGDVQVASTEQIEEVGTIISDAVNTAMERWIREFDRGNIYG